MAANAQAPDPKLELEHLGSDLGGALDRLGDAIDKSKSSVIKWIAGMMVIQGACIVALVKFLPGGIHS